MPIEKPKDRADRPVGPRKFLHWGGKYYVVRNAAHRIDHEDVAIISPLSREQAQHYCRGRDEGHSDTSLFEQLFANAQLQGGTKIPVPLSLLTEGQLIHLIRHHLGEGVTGLDRLDRKALEAILKALYSR